MKQGGELYERLRVDGFRTCVSGASDTRPVWLYDVSSLEEPSRMYHSQDFSTGARVRRVLAPPTPPLTPARARAAHHQTRSVAQVAGLDQDEDQDEFAGLLEGGACAARLAAAKAAYYF